MEAPMGKVTNYAVLVSIKDTEAKAIEAASPSSTSFEQALTKLTTDSIRELANGGILIPSQVAQRIESAISTKDPDAILDYVEMAVNRKGEAVRVEWIVDPTQISFYQEIAERNGQSLEQLLKDTLDYAFLQGWVGNTPTNVHCALFDEQQYRDLQKLFGKDMVLGSDIYNLIAQMKAIRADELEEDAVLGSLDQR
jgi:hypothetical protein